MQRTRQALIGLIAAMSICATTAEANVFQIHAISVPNAIRNDDQGFTRESAKLIPDERLRAMAMSIIRVASRAYGTSLDGEQELEVAWVRVNADDEIVDYGTLPTDPMQCSTKLVMDTSAFPWKLLSATCLNPCGSSCHVCTSGIPSDLTKWCQCSTQPCGAPPY